MLLVSIRVWSLGLHRTCSGMVTSGLFLIFLSSFQDLIFVVSYLIFVYLTVDVSSGTRKLYIIRYGLGFLPLWALIILGYFRKRSFTVPPSLGRPISWSVRMQDIYGLYLISLILKMGFIRRYMLISAIFWNLRR
ncbi:unnamed protein product [Brassica oleracea var. botrytis]